MPVQQVEKVLNDAMGEFLAARVPEGMLANYSVSQVTHEFEGECEEHHEPIITTAVVWQIYLYIDKVDADDDDDTSKPYRMSALVPYDYLSDGDVGFLRKTLEDLWSNYTFATMMVEVDGELEQVISDPEE